MPIVSTWIKNEDWDTYYLLSSTKQWGEFVHTALNSNLVPSSSEPVIIETNGKPVHEGKLTEAVRYIGKNYIGNPKVPDILKQGKGGRYSGDTPLVGPEIPEDEPEEFTNQPVDDPLEKDGMLTEAVLSKQFEDGRKSAESATFPLNTLPNGNIRRSPEEVEKLEGYFKGVRKTQAKEAAELEDELDSIG